jgi:hypothetical protein
LKPAAEYLAFALWLDLGDPAMVAALLREDGWDASTAAVEAVVIERSAAALARSLGSGRAAQPHSRTAATSRPAASA